MKRITKADLKHLSEEELFEALEDEMSAMGLSRFDDDPIDVLIASIRRAKAASTKSI